MRMALARYERMRQASSSEARKKDTREKIELGGLIAKAGLRYEKRAVLLGALIELRRRLRTDEAERARLAAIGVEAFGRDGE
ncbi:conjugal transfer protein TraD (plasmid) [Bradyrhizobium diazoefficiens]|uniref:Conjugal transfer protein TraD n=2 Tax=Bradyrhizobium TaxID=374 RepID=A0A0E4BXR6_9BRAD|nr:conjugal transfer protein TraD [Bradyrhizobium diazoefficiens]BAR63403.1 conjugal transfer protein TraD [Bradyrhizobium diazoefficiens]BAR63702.1 conjugal transfer protein TraD [Bradyrhizobium diazoefficiens]